MNYDNPELRDLLAGHYVLGHMTPRVKARFQRLLLTQAGYAHAVMAWEERLAPMLYAARPETPPQHIRRHLLRQIRRDVPAARPSRFGPFAINSRALAGIATAAFLVVLGLYLWQPLRMAPAPANQYAVITTQQGSAQWVVTVSGQQVYIHAVGQVAPPAGKSFQLWMLPANGANPVSLGLLPVQGEANEVLSKVTKAELKSAQGLAVSIEPQGGSPTGQPTGPVIYTAPIATI